MPFDKVMHKFKKGELHSGSKKGPKVENRKQAIAIMLSEKKKAGEGKTEYQSEDTEPIQEEKTETKKKEKKEKHTKKEKHYKISMA
jgi:hypothetical protein